MESRKAAELLISTSPFLQGNRPTLTPLPSSTTPGFELTSSEQPSSPVPSNGSAGSVGQSHGTSAGFCEICKKHVSNRTNHKYVHSQVKFKCKICGYLYSRKDTLKDHIRGKHNTRYSTQDLNQLVETVTPNPNGTPHTNHSARGAKKNHLSKPESGLMTNPALLASLNPPGAKVDKDLALTPDVEMVEANGKPETNNNNNECEKLVDEDQNGPV